MRTNYRMQRLHVLQDISQGAEIEPAAAQVHYLGNVLRLKPGGQLLIFNGRDGEWLAEITGMTRRGMTLCALTRTRPQPPSCDLIYCFAPLRQGRLDYVVQKAVEMGASVIRPVITQHTQTQAVRVERLQANAVEAAEQCGILAIPQVEEPVRLEHMLQQWETQRHLIFCDEGSQTSNPLPILAALPRNKLGLLIGPEGGFSEDERRKLRALAFVTTIPLGPRILRADTAGVAALAVIQATIGDWNT